jgi:antitoxin (DNA-binding transcriptional repressor) of toxin-antitoxin stability system
MSEGCWELNKPLELNKIANNSLSVLTVFSVVNHTGIGIFENPQDRGKIHAVFGQIGRFLGRVEFQLHASNVCRAQPWEGPAPSGPKFFMEGAEPLSENLASDNNQSTFLPRKRMILLSMILPNLPSKPLGGKNETAECSTSSGQEMQGLTKIKIQTNLSNMHTITSRDLAHRPGEIRKLLAAGETLQWTSHGVSVALIQPASPSAPDKKPDWMARARSAGAVNLSKSPLADSIYADRG